MFIGNLYRVFLPARKHYIPHQHNTSKYENTGKNCGKHTQAYDYVLLGADCAILIVYYSQTVIVFFLQGRQFISCNKHTHRVVPYQ